MRASQMPSAPASRIQKMTKGGGDEGHGHIQELYSKSQKEPVALLAWAEEGPRPSLKEVTNPNTAFHEMHC